MRLRYTFKLLSRTLPGLLMLSGQVLAQENSLKSFTGERAYHLEGIYSSRTGVNPSFHFTDPNDVPTDLPGSSSPATELIDQRSLKSRSFRKADGEIVVECNSKNIFYYNERHELRALSGKLGMLTATGWSAPHQSYPASLDKDGSTSIAVSASLSLRFNQNCLIGGKSILLNDYTVGEEGMFVHDVLPGIDKRIVFSENSIETDYIIRQKTAGASGDLTFSEQIQIPSNCKISRVPAIPTGDQYRSPGSKELPEDLVITDETGKEQGRFRAPLFYDANRVLQRCEYRWSQTDNRWLLEFTVPAAWLNDPARVYPVTVDPLVTGPTANYPFQFMNSCLMPSYASDSILVTIPADITITAFNVTDSYYADQFAPAQMKYGSMYLTTARCGSTPNYSVASPRGDSAGYAYLDNADLKSYLACCFTPACHTQTFYLAHHLGRNNYGPGCNQNFIYYSPSSPWPFKAYVVGRTVETTQNQWTVTPGALCSDSCTLRLHAFTNFGVPPYTITHPWTGASVVYGTATGSCSSTGTADIYLRIPGCPTTCGTVHTLSVPAPYIVDVCGDTVQGLSPKNVTINPVPVLTASPQSLCSGNALTLPVTSCVTGTTMTWTATNGTHGTTSTINAVLTNNTLTPDTVKYTISPVANGCHGPSLTVPVAVNPMPTSEAGRGDTIRDGDQVQLNGSGTGGTLTYSWSPSTGLSCTSCPNPMASPNFSLSYILTVTNQYGCSSSDTLDITVNPGDETLYIPDCFTPNGDGKNDIFNVYGYPLISVDLKIYDRWGELIYETTDMNKGWDGRYKGKKVEEGVYVYYVDVMWESQRPATKVGIVTVLR